MENNKEVYHISTKLLIKILNLNRENKGLGKLEDALIARKLGILYTFKTNVYLNFKNDYVNLMLDELTILEEIIDYYFNVEMKAATMKCFTIKLEKQENTLVKIEQDESIGLEEILKFYSNIELNDKNKAEEKPTVSDQKIKVPSSNGNFFQKLIKLFR